MTKYLVVFVLLLAFMFAGYTIGKSGFSLDDLSTLICGEKKPGTKTPG